MQDMEGKEPQLGDDGVDRAIRKTSGILELANKIAQLLPGDLLRIFVQNAF